MAVEGENTIQVRQTDVAGNVSPAATLSFTLDTTRYTLHVVRSDLVAEPAVLR